MIVEQAKMNCPKLHNVTLLGALISIPMSVILSRITIRLGTEWAILLATLGDVAAAALLGVIEPKMETELALVTVFLYAGIRLAPAMSVLVFQ
jgi:hypothetical protein